MRGGIGFAFKPRWPWPSGNQRLVIGRRKQGVPALGPHPGLPRMVSLSISRRQLCPRDMHYAKGKWEPNTVLQPQPLRHRARRALGRGRSMAGMARARILLLGLADRQHLDLYACSVRRMRWCPMTGEFG